MPVGASAHFMALSKEEDTYVSYEEEDTCTFHGTVQGGGYIRVI